MRLLRHLLVLTAFFLTGSGIALAEPPAQLAGVDIPAPFLQQAQAIIQTTDKPQAALVAAGLARVFTTVDSAAQAPDLYPLEITAREKKLGLWARSDHQILTPTTASQNLHQFQIVEGAVAEVARVGDTTYLNFDRDWRRDFTIAMSNALAKQLSAEALKNQAVRVRGWLHSKNGPMITVTHAEQLEIIHAR